MNALLNRLRHLLRKLPRAQGKFRQRYPQYRIGVGTYGMPQVHDWNEGSTLRICSPVIGAFLDYVRTRSARQQ